MKRLRLIFFLFACAVMLLIVCAACKGSSTPQPDAITSPTSVSEAPHTQGADAEQQAAEASGSVLSGGVLLPNGLFPDSARPLPAALPERYYENTILELIPSGDYGRIWPYIGGYVNSYMGTWSGIIGICDDEGRIICDPAYNNAELIENGGHSLYVFTKYSVNRTGYYEGSYAATIAALDGSWAGTFDHALWEEASSYEYTPPIKSWYDLSRGYRWRDTVSYDYITAKRDGLWGVIDWDGSVLLPFEYLEPLCFHEGLASVLSEDGETFRYIDIAGETVLGPFEAPPRPKMEYGLQGFDLDATPKTYKLMLFDGYAKFYENGKFGIIDRAGNIVIPAEYEFITCMNGGMAMFATFSSGSEAREMPERFGIVNSAGDVIVSPMDYNYIYYQTPEYLDGCALIIQSNNPAGDLIAYDGTRTPYEASFPFYTKDGYLEFCNSDVKLSLDRYYLEYINSNLIYGNSIIVFDRDNHTWAIYDYGGNQVTPENQGGGLQRIVGRRNTGYLIIDVSTPGVWEWPPPVMIYDLSGKALLEDAYYVIIPVGDRFMVRGKNTAGLVDAYGSFIIMVDVTAYGTD